MPPQADASVDHVLVTGGAGFIGRTVVRVLRAAGATVTVADLRAPTDRAVVDDPGVEVVVGDLRDPAVRERVVTPGTTGVAHLAALTSVLESVRHPAASYETNVAMTAGLLERVREVGVERFVFASTNAVTGDVGAGPITEDLPLAPLTPYGATKAAAEMLLSAYVNSYGIRGAALRFANVYGPGMGHKDSFIPRLMRAARDGGEVEIYGDGTQVRDFVHVGDVAAAVRDAVLDGWTGPVILGSAESVSVLDLLGLVRRVTGRPVAATHVPAKAGEMPAVIVRTDRARALGWEARTSLHDGLAGVWEEFRAAPATAGR